MPPTRGDGLRARFHRGVHRVGADVEGAHRRPVLLQLLHDEDVGPSDDVGDQEGPHGGDRRGGVAQGDPLRSDARLHLADEEVQPPRVLFLREGKRI